MEDAAVMRTTSSRHQDANHNRRAKQRTRSRDQRSSRSCPLCKQAGRPDVHFLSECSFLPAKDRKYMAKARQIVNIIDDDTEFDCQPDAFDEVDNDIAPSGDTPTAMRVQVRQSPYLDVFYGHQTARLTIDSGATGNMICLAAARRLGVPTKASSQSAHQADGSSPLNVTAETKFLLTCDGVKFTFEGLVVENLDVDILAGTPFMEANDISIRPARRQVTLGDGSTYTYGSNPQTTLNTIRRACVLRAPTQPTTIWPGDFIEMDITGDFHRPDETFALEPHRSPQTRATDDCSVTSPPTQPRNTRTDVTHSTSIRLDPDNQLSHSQLAEFRKIHQDFDDVFNPCIKGYNGASGPFQAVVNMGPVQPPQRKGRLPQYSRNKLIELQQKFDELEQMGVFARPEDIQVNVEYINPSFLVKKPSGGSRLVTAFADVGRYSKPQPSLLPSVDSTLNQIAQWEYIIATDLTKAFYQIPLSRESLKYCGVATPFRGVRVYTRSAMGMPGSETALEELMCRVLGDLLADCIVAKIADDLYCGANSVEELLVNWKHATAGLQSADNILWTDTLYDAFHVAQSALSTNRAITLPRPSDQLWIVTDAAVKSHGIGSTLYISRHNKLHLAGFFSAKLRGRQATWLPCEVEALCIAVSVTHFSPYIIQSHHKPCVLTDSKPCVQAYEKLCRGEFSASPRVTTFLSAASRYQASVRHLSGTENIPSDFASRNAQPCSTPSCQVCSFVERIEDSTVRSLSIQDIVSGNARLPFTNTEAWHDLQSECSALRRTHAHLTQGTRPSKKMTDIKDIKRYLNTVTIAKDGLLVVKRSDPFVPSRECIVIPRQVLDGFLTAMHIRLSHPSCHQMKQIIRRYFYALDLDRSIQQVCSSCHQCASLRKVPRSLAEQSTTDPPEVVGISFAADVIKRECQLVLVLRECVTSFTTACLVEDERHTSLRDALVY
ncbi:uncharacterized protein [Ptychodera flava]|uniref:uncharacterized protein n=1 Tax=Ptychodera flava TaxID=63121 RepID=UPI00396A68CA